MDTYSSCNSTSTSALVKLDLRLLDQCSLSALTGLAFELPLCGYGRFRLHTSLLWRALIRSWRGVYVCKSRCTRTRFQFKKTLSGGAQLRTLLLRRTAFSSVHEFGGGLFLTLFFRNP